jgi:hypothetical protein
MPRRNIVLPRRNIVHLKTQEPTQEVLRTHGRVSLIKETTYQGVVAYAVSYPAKIGNENSLSNMCSVFLNLNEAQMEYARFDEYFNG